MQRRVKVMIGVGTLVVLVLSVVVFSQSSAFDIDEFEVKSNIETPTQAVIQISGLSKGDQLFPLNFRAIESSVGRLPWVKDVKISLGWGGKITFNITERQPRAVAFSRQGYALLDAQGRVLEILGTVTNCEDWAAQFPQTVCIANLIVPSTPGVFIRQARLPIIQIAEHIQTIQRCLQPETDVKKCPEGKMVKLALFIRQIVLHDSGESAVSLQLKGGGWIYLGDPTDRLKAKLQGAFRTLSKANVSKDLCGGAFLDLSSVNTAILTKDSSC